LKKEILANIIWWVRLDLGISLFVVTTFLGPLIKGTLLAPILYRKILTVSFSLK